MWVNTSHPEKADIFLGPQIARIIGPHRVGLALRFIRYVVLCFVEWSGFALCCVVLSCIFLCSVCCGVFAFHVTLHYSSCVLLCYALDSVVLTFVVPYILYDFDSIAELGLVFRSVPCSSVLSQSEAGDFNQLLILFSYSNRFSLVISMTKLV